MRREQRRELRRCCRTSSPEAVLSLVPASSHRWLDLYARKLEEFPSRVEPITDDSWLSALGDPRRAADWIGYLEREIAERPWREALTRRWPRLLPGMYGGSTHPVVRVGHAVRTLLSGETTLSGEITEPRLAELAHGLGYWAARHRHVAGHAPLPGADSAAAALDTVPPIALRNGGFSARLDRVRALPVWAAAVTEPSDAYRHLAELVRAATHRYATHGHGEETMLVHAATARNAVLREEVFERALAHGDASCRRSSRAAWSR